MSTPSGMTRTLLGADPEVAADVVAGGLRRGQDRAAPPGDPGLHPDEGVPAPLGQPGQPPGRGQLDPPVHADRVVDAGHQRQAQPGQPEQRRRPAPGCRARGRSRRGGPAAARRARRLNVSGSGNAPVHMAANSSTSIQSRYSRRPRRCGTGRAPGTGPGWAPCAGRAPARARGRAGRRRPRRGGRARPARGTGAAGRCPGRRSAACCGRTPARPGAGDPCRRARSRRTFSSASAVWPVMTSPLTPRQRNITSGVPPVLLRSAVLRRHGCRVVA